MILVTDDFQDLSLGVVPSHWGPYGCPTQVCGMIQSPIYWFSGCIRWIGYNPCPQVASNQVRELEGCIWDQQDNEAVSTED